MTEELLNAAMGDTEIRSLIKKYGAHRCLLIAADLLPELPAAQPVDAEKVEAYLFIHNDATQMVFKPDDASARSLISKGWKPIELVRKQAAQPVDTSRKIGASMYSVDFGDERPDRPDMDVD